MFIWKNTLKRAPAYPSSIPFTNSDGVTYPSIPMELLIEIPDVTFEGDDEAFYIRREIEDSPYVEFERKTEDVILEIKNTRIKDQIELKETKEKLPRVVREFMLLFMEANFSNEQLAMNPGYVAVKASDNAIRDLRDQLK